MAKKTGVLKGDQTGDVMELGKAKSIAAGKSGGGAKKPMGGGTKQKKFMGGKKRGM